MMLRIAGYLLISPPRSYCRQPMRSARARRRSRSFMPERLPMA